METRHTLSGEDDREGVQENRSRRENRADRKQAGEPFQYDERDRERDRAGDHAHHDRVAFRSFGRARGQRLEKDDRLGPFTHHGKEGGQAERERRTLAAARDFHLRADELAPPLRLRLGSNPRTYVEERRRGEELEDAP